MSDKQIGMKKHWTFFTKKIEPNFYLIIPNDAYCLSCVVYVLNF